MGRQILLGCSALWTLLGYPSFSAFPINQSEIPSFHKGARFTSLVQREKGTTCSGCLAVCPHFDSASRQTGFGLENASQLAWGCVPLRFRRVGAHPATICCGRSPSTQRGRFSFGFPSRPTNKNKWHQTDLREAHGDLGRKFTCEDPDWIASAQFRPSSQRGITGSPSMHVLCSEIAYCTLVKNVQNSQILLFFQGHGCTNWGKTY